MGSFWITTPAIIVYAYLSRFISMIFLIFQGVCILSLAYKINEFLVDLHSESGSAFSLMFLLGFTIGIYVLDGFLLYLLYKWFGGCTFNVVLLLIFIAVAALCLVLTILRARENASILTNGIVMSYILYLTWAALVSDPNPQCNTLLHSESAIITQIALGVGFTIVCILSFPLITQVSNPGYKEEWDDEEQPLDEVELGGKSVNVEESFVFPISYETIYFHVMMICASCYYAMLLSNWNDLEVSFPRIT